MEENIDQKYIKEIENLDGREWYYTFHRLAQISYQSLYIAARENGMTPNQAASFCTSKWVRKTEDEGIITQKMCEMFDKLLYDGVADGMTNLKYDIDSVSRTELYDELLCLYENCRKMAVEIYKDE